MRVRPRLLQYKMSTEMGIHVEGAAKIYVPIASGSNKPAAGSAEKDKQGPKNVFVNPIQEFNRDISIVAIRTWSEMFAKEKLDAWERKQSRRTAKQQNGERSGKRRKGEDGQSIEVKIDGEVGNVNVRCFELIYVYRHLLKYQGLLRSSLKRTSSPSSKHWQLRVCVPFDMLSNYLSSGASCFGLLFIELISLHDSQMGTSERSLPRSNRLHASQPSAQFPQRWQYRS